MGAYIVLYPRVRVHTLVFLFIYVQVLTLPAVVLLGLWFAAVIAVWPELPATVGGLIGAEVRIDLLRTPAVPAFYDASGLVLITVTELIARSGP